jgi:hypothetical protein
VAAVGRPALAPETMLGAMATLDLPPDAAFAAREATLPDPLEARLLDAGIEVPIHPWPRDPAPGERRRRLLRVSAHLHNDAGEYAHLAGRLRALLAEEGA